MVISFWGCIFYNTRWYFPSCFFWRHPSKQVEIAKQISANQHLHIFFSPVGRWQRPVSGRRAVESLPAISAELSPDGGRGEVEGRHGVFPESTR